MTLSLIFAFLRRFWPVLVAGLLFMGCWQFVEKQKRLAAEKAVLSEQAVYLKKKAEVLEDTLKEEVAISQVVAEQAETALIALKDRDKQITTLRTDHDYLRREIRNIANAASPEDCLNQPVHPDVRRLLVGPEVAARIPPGPGQP
jgi:hypothetical protein